MKIFISWSGARSKAVAEALKEWLPRVIQASEPWVSSEITKGSRWSPEISRRLEESRVGIICLTRENLNAAWILFEAGAISKTKDAHVCTFLLDVAPADVEQPLGQFQHTLPNQNDVRLLVTTINRAVRDAGEREVAEGDLEEVYLAFWPKLEARLAEITAAGSADLPAVRKDRELLEEIIEILRAMDRRLGTAGGPFYRGDVQATVRERLLTDALTDHLVTEKAKLAAMEGVNAFRRLSTEETETFLEAYRRRVAARGGAKASDEGTGEVS